MHSNVEGIVAIFEQLKDELGVGQEANEEDKERVARRLDMLVGPVWRLEVYAGTDKGEDPFGGGWKPDMPLMSNVNSWDIDCLYHKLRKFAKNREMDAARQHLEHMPEQMNREAYKKMKPTSECIKVVIE